MAAWLWDQRVSRDWRRIARASTAARRFLRCPQVDAALPGSALAGSSFLGELFVLAPLAEELRAPTGVTIHGGVGAKRSILLEGG